MGNRIEWATVRDVPPHLAPQGEYVDDHGNENDTWALAERHGIVIEGTLPEWSDWTHKLLAHIREREAEEALADAKENGPRKIGILVHPTMERVIVTGTPDDDSWTVDGDDAAKIVEVWAQHQQHTSESIHEDSDFILGWLHEGRPIVGAWTEYIDDDTYSIDSFPQAGVLEVFEP